MSIERGGRDFAENIISDVPRQFFWAMMEKLTPARRVLLLIALVLLFAGRRCTADHPQRPGQDLRADTHFYGGLLMFVLLILEVGDRVVMKRDLQIAKEIQAWLLPSKPPAVPGLEIAFVTRPANTVAGDFYDVFTRSDDATFNVSARHCRCRRQEHSRRHAYGDVSGEPEDAVQRSAL